MAYGAVYILLFSLFRNIGFSRSIFRLPQGTGFLSTLISMLTTNIGLSGFGMISAMVLLQGEVGIWFILAIFMGTGMKIFFFGPLWAQFDWANENHFILRRFAPKWGQVLHSFRGIYVGLLVNAIVISGMMIAFADMMHAFAGIPRQPALYFSFVFLLINLSRNSLSSKIFSDTYNFVLLILVLVTGLVLSGGILSDVQLMNEGARSTLGAFPYTDTPFFQAFSALCGYTVVVCTDV